MAPVNKGKPKDKVDRPPLNSLADIALRQRRQEAAVGSALEIPKSSYASRASDPDSVRAYGHPNDTPRQDLLFGLFRKEWYDNMPGAEDPRKKRTRKPRNNYI